jgi:hypothetical protein
MDRLRCRTPRCGRLTKPKSPWCGRCASRKWAKEHPVAYAYAHLRGNAKRRGHPFTLTFEAFARLCDETGYLHGKGRMSDCLSIDRIDPTKGYADDNVRVITVSMNSRFSHAPLPGWLREQLEKELAAGKTPST